MGARKRSSPWKDPGREIDGNAPLPKRIWQMLDAGLAEWLARFQAALGFDAKKAAKDLGAKPELQATPAGGCLIGLIILIILFVLIVGLIIAAMAWLTNPSSVEEGAANIPFTSSPDAVTTGEPLVPISGTWEIENMAFVEGCGPGDLSSGFETGTIEVLDEGAAIRATPSNPTPGQTAVLLQRTEYSPEHATYWNRAGWVTIEMRFSTPDTVESVIYYEAIAGQPEICVIRPAKGHLLTPANTGSGDGQDSPPPGSAPTSGNDNSPGGENGSPEENGQIPAGVSIPQPGETRLELGGETFTFAEGPDCTITDDSFAITGTTTVSGSNQIDIALNGNRIGDQWAIGINALSSTSGISMSSVGDAVGTPIINNNVLYIEADFIRVLNEDIENAEPMGLGTIICNCGS